MSTIYVFSSELPALLTPASGDIVLLYDTSVGRMKRCTWSAVAALEKNNAMATSAAATLGFYGQTAVDQGTFATKAKTALAVATMSKGNAAGVWAWATTTAANAFHRRAKQAQTDLLTLMRRIDSTGLVAIDGV